MKIDIVISLAILTFLCPLYAIGHDFEDDVTPIEQEDIKTIDQINN